MPISFETENALLKLPDTAEMHARAFLHLWGMQCDVATCRM